MSGNVTDSIEHLLALKVMRLTRPSLEIAKNIITSESQDLVKNSFSNLNKNDSSSVESCETLASGQFLVLPQSFGNIYLGETFSSYTCVHNCTSIPVSAVSVKADLQSSNSRINLPIHVNRQIPITLQPDETLDDVIHYEVKEIGTHILVCEVSYISPAGLPQSFRKFFKFQVLKPLDVKTKFYNAETDEILLEAQIQNITASTICLEKVELESSEHYTVQSLNIMENGESVFSSRKKLQTQNSCQFLYCIKPIPSIATDIKTLKAANNIGKLDIVWRSSNFAERGRLQTSTLQRSSVEYGDLRLTVVEAESICKISEPFDFKCRVINTSGRTMDLTLNLNTKPKKGCHYTGSSEYGIGNLESGKFLDFKLTVFPVRRGLTTISDLQLTDNFMKKTYEFEDFLQVYVVDKEFDEKNFEMNDYVKYNFVENIKI